MNSINNGANPKAFPEDARYGGEKYLCKNLGVKGGGGHLLEGGVFSGAYGIQ